MDRDPGSRQRASLRASDADRERFVEALRQHHAEGRLTAEELSERTRQAYAGPDLRRPGRAGHRPAAAPPAGRPATPAGVGQPAARLRPPGARRAEAKAALVRSILWFGLISVVLLVVWAMTGRDYFWPVWPILGFSFALLWQAFNVYGPRPFDDDQGRPRNP
jgi:uncharacterized protein DUF1707/2TM domain-containing protein